MANTGYTQITVDYRNYTAHRLAWLWMTGAWPKIDIDHRNGVRCDTRWSNLREATRSQNGQNRKAKGNWKGVSFVRGLYVAQLKFRGKNTVLGRFTCPAAANFSYTVAASKLFGEFARS